MINPELPRLITDVTFFEISFVFEPINPDCVIVSIKEVEDG